jgi:hypothetical protein
VALRFGRIGTDLALYPSSNVRDDEATCSLDSSGSLGIFRAVDPRVPAELEARRIDPAIVSLLIDIGRGHDLEICSDDGTKQLALAADPEAYAAVFVSRTGLSIAMDPVVARALGEQTGWRVEVKTHTTSYLHAPASDIRDGQVSLVRQALVDALDRSFHGPRWQRGGADQRHRHGDTCPRCGVQMSLLALCDNCDG